MYLQALDNGFGVLEPGVEFMSVKITCLKLSVFHVVRTCFLTRYACDSVIDTRNVPAVVHAKTTTTHVNPLMHTITIL